MQTFLANCTVRRFDRGDKIRIGRGPHELTTALVCIGESWLEL